MLKPFFTATVMSSAFVGAAHADGYGAHSHPHAHPHTGHAHSAAPVDPGLQHSHGDAALGTTHTHAVNGVTVRHTHSTRIATNDTVVDKWDRRIAAREARYQSGQVGAGFGPYTVAEWQARARAGQPGLTHYQEPWPQGRYRGY